MPVPIEAVGLYAGSGGVIVAAAMKLLPLLFNKANGKNNSNNSKPGKADICIKRGYKIGEHDLVIKQLCANMKEYKNDAKEARKEDMEKAEIARIENNAILKNIFDKLDDLK